MIAVFKHTALRLWLAAFFVGPATLVVLQAGHSFLPLKRSILSLAGLLFSLFMMAGFFLNRLGIIIIDRLLREAAVWERSGMYHEAEETYLKALAICDSFFLSPIKRTSKLKQVSSGLARFYLAGAEKKPEMEKFILAYLFAWPDDGEAAESWLQLIFNRQENQKNCQELAGLIASQHPENRQILKLLTEYYLNNERTDFSALQVYRKALATDQAVSNHLISRLALLFLREGRADEWSFKIYLRAYIINNNQSDLIKGIAACCYHIRETEQNRRLFQQADKLLNEIDEHQLESWALAFSSPMAVLPDKKLSWVFLSGQILSKQLTLLYKKISLLIIACHDNFSRNVKIIIKRLWLSTKIKSYAKKALILLLTSAVLIFLVNTANYLKTSKDNAPHILKPLSTVVTDPFTLQVAAYLKPEDAMQYVKMLKSHGLKAYWVEAVGTKRKWYQVRLSHFKTKESAKKLGDSLKNRGIIDDYYVANYPKAQ